MFWKNDWFRLLTVSDELGCQYIDDEGWQELTCTPVLYRTVRYSISVQVYRASFTGCDCDESLPNANDFCPRRQVSRRLIDGEKTLMFTSGMQKVQMPGGRVRVRPQLCQSWRALPKEWAVCQLSVSSSRWDDEDEDKDDDDDDDQSTDQAVTVMSMLLTPTASVFLEKFARWDYLRLYRRYQGDI